MDASNGGSPTPTGGFNVNSTSPIRNSQSSPENSPRTEQNQMDTSIELNGLKTSIDNRSSQQFCLRWNNHQVSKYKFETLELFNFHFDVHGFSSRAAFDCIPTSICLKN